MRPTRLRSDHDAAVRALLGALACLAAAEDGRDVVQALTWAQSWCRHAEMCIERSKVAAEGTTAPSEEEGTP